VDTSRLSQKTLSPDLVKLPSSQGAAAATPVKVTQVAKAEKANSLVVIYILSFVTVALAVWVAALRDLDMIQMNDLGLISILPPAAFVSLFILAVSFCITLYYLPNATPLILLHLFSLIYMLHGAASLAIELPRFGPAWRHVGIIEYITRTGGIDPRIDAYFNWPGFFSTMAMVSQAAGLNNALPLLKWAPVFFEILYLAPLWLIFNLATKDKRQVWFAIWIFYIANWVGQDYFSPQAINFFYFLVIVYILLRWFSASAENQLLVRIIQRLSINLHWMESILSHQPAQEPGISPRQRFFLYLLVVMLFWVSVSSHQLTPFAILIAVSGLVLLKIISPRSLPLLMVVLIGVWFSYMASTYFNGRIEEMVANVGQVESVVSANVTERLQGSPQHIIILQIRMLSTLVIWSWAFIGAVYRICQGHKDLPMLLMMASPGPLLLLQAYGGEMLLRTYLFTLPFAAFFAAALFFPTPAQGPSLKKAGYAILFSVIAISAFLFARYGNARMESFTSRELEAVQYFYQNAAPGALLASPEPSMPFKYQQYEQYKYLRLEQPLLTGSTAEIITLMDHSRYPEAYLLLTRSQIAQMNMFFGLQSEFWHQFYNALQASGRMRLIYQNEDARIYQLISQVEGR
jgi:hypothetical protein